MSVEVEIIPVSQRFFKWEEICSEMKNLSVNSTKIIDKDGEIELLAAKSCHPLPNETLLLPTNYYGIDIEGRKSLEIAYMSNRDSYTGEFDVLHDYGRRNTNLNLNDIADSWKKSGYSCTVSSHPRRHPHESHFMMLLVVAIAKLCHGFIVIKENEQFSLPFGVYRPDEFAAAVPLFSGAH